MLRHTSVLQHPSCKDRLFPTLQLYGRPIQDTLLAHRCSFAPEWQQAAYTLQQSEAFYNTHTCSLPDMAHQ